MKILLVHYRYFVSGGPERYLFNIKKALEEQGHTVIPFSIKNSNNEPCAYEEYFVRNIGNSNEVFVNKYPKSLQTYWDLICREFYSLEVRRKLEDLIATERPDVCYLLVYKRALSPSVIDACKKYNIPIINRISDYNTVCGAGSLYREGRYCELCLKDESFCAKNKCIKGSAVFSWMRYLSIRFHKKMEMANKINDYVCTNQYMANMMQQYGYPVEKLHVIPTFFKEDEKIKSWDKTNNVDQTRINFLFIGNVDESKGIYDLLKAIAMLVKKTQKFHLYVVGGLHVEENQRVKEIVDEAKLGDYITFVPFLKGREVFKYYLKANVSILPARWVENLPNTLIESIYFKRPVIVPEWGSFKYTTDESVSFRYKALSSQALYECMLKVCSNPELIVEKSNNCKAFFENNFSEKVHLKKLIQLFSRGEKNENL